MCVLIAILLIVLDLFLWAFFPLSSFVHFFYDLMINFSAVFRFLILLSTELFSLQLPWGFDIADYI